MEFNEVKVWDEFFHFKLDLPKYFQGIFSSVRTVKCFKYPNWSADKPRGPRLALLEIKDDTAYIRFIGHVQNKSSEKTVVISIEMEIA